MNIETLREYCISKKGVTESFPFDEVTLVFKVMNKMFALTSLNKELSISIKCDPERAIVLRQEYESIQPAFHMNKKHWNSLFIDGSLSKDHIEELIDHSYDLVVKSLPKKVKEELGDM